MIRKPVNCHQCNKEFIPSRTNGINCSPECKEIYRRKQRLQKSKYWQESKKIRMPKAPMPFDDYDWDDFNRLPKGHNYG